MELTMFIFLAGLLVSSHAGAPPTAHQGLFTSSTVDLSITDVIHAAHPARPNTTTIVNVTLTSHSYIYLVDRHNASVFQKRFDVSRNLVVEIPTAKTVDLGATTTIYAVHAANMTTMVMKDVVLTSSSSIYMVDSSTGRILEKLSLWRNVVVEVPVRAHGIGSATAPAAAAATTTTTTTTVQTDTNTTKHWLTTTAVINTVQGDSSITSTSSVGVTSPWMTSQMTNTTTTLLCEDDAETNCWGQPDTHCFGVYQTWAKRHCPVRCGYCPDHPSPCEDKLTICDQFESIVCAAPLYQMWAQINCRKHCNMCGHVPSHSPPTAETAAAASVSTTASSACEDDPAVGCRRMPIEGCFGTSETWARQHCRLRCGFCKACKDKVNCGMYEDYICTLPQYKVWAQDNCPQRCGWC